MKRYQECSLAEKIWRRRWYALIPIWTIDSYMSGKNSLNQSFDVAVGMAHYKMRWYYTLEEID